MKVISQEMYDDGSAWIALVEVGGIMYRASYVSNKLDCSIGPYRNNPKRPRWHIKAVKKWAQSQVEKFPSEWIKAHQEMYA